MKSMHLFSRLIGGIIFLSLLSSCNQDEPLLLNEKHTPEVLPPTETFVFQNFEGSGIDFVILPKLLNTITSQRIKKIVTDDDTDSGSVNGEQMLFELMTFYPDAEESVNTQLHFQLCENGLLQLTHLSEDGEPFASMIYRGNELIEIQIHEARNLSQISGLPFYRASMGMKTFYDCVNNEYQRIKGVIEGDMINDITCKVLFFFCKPLMVMTAVEECR